MTAAPTMPTVEGLAARMRAEVRADITAGTVPAGITEFAELHEHVDANAYGGAFSSVIPALYDDNDDLDPWADEYHERSLRAQDLTNAWICTGMPPEEATPTGNIPTRAAEAIEQAYPELTGLARLETTGGNVLALAVPIAGRVFVIGEDGSEGNAELVNWDPATWAGDEQYDSLTDDNAPTVHAIGTIHHLLSRIADLHQRNR